ncbi:uncharacterized protein EDB91DRAFT_1351131 [Suillus paluster]|uniref:uncharacterized protein n=1 Tax=Suillus paluster TaxID=48578 RepID=UPI001B864E1C|nr:uncharacterized protein EDB91DRAFT_1351131 [Suillus paluster]KAG1723732.1 hypothetical protein EDB91DRAFT_1351131 [Suillus paluster]
MAVYPSEKISEFRMSMDNVASTATALHQAFKGAGMSFDSIETGWKTIETETFCEAFGRAWSGDLTLGFARIWNPYSAAEERGIPLDSVSEELGNRFRALFEELKEQFPPPGEASGHENRTVMITTVLDRIEESFLQVAINRGMSEEVLKSHCSSLKSGVQHIVVTIGDLYEQHPELAWTLSCIATGAIFSQGILLTILRVFGLGALGPIKGTAATWLQAWLFGPAVPRGSWFAVLQRLAMTGAKL